MIYSFNQLKQESIAIIFSFNVEPPTQLHLLLPLPPIQNKIKCRPTLPYIFFWNSPRHKYQPRCPIEKKMRCFHFFRKFVPVPHSGSHIITKNHSEFRFFFPRADETRKLPYHNKHAWLHKVRLNSPQ